MKLRKWVMVRRRCSESLQREERNVRRVPKRCQVSKSGDLSRTRSQVEDNVVGKAVKVVRVSFLSDVVIA